MPEEAPVTSAMPLAKSADDLEAAFASMKSEAAALMPTRSAPTFNLGKQIADLALAAHLLSCNTFKRIAAWRAMR